MDAVAIPLANTRRRFEKIKDLVKCALEIAPIKTGEELGMKESYDEGLANHIGPESCADNGNIIEN
jgi:hypothetical protein